MVVARSWLVMTRVSSVSFPNAPNAWYTTNLKAAMAQWSFEPALRNGCKVPRFYQFMVDLRPRR